MKRDGMIRRGHQTGRRGFLARVSLLILVLGLVAAACSSSDDGAASPETTKAGPDFQAAIITGTAGLGDKSFNDSANTGLQRAATELGIRTVVIESAQNSDFEPNLDQAPRQGNNIAFAIGFQMVDAVTAAAENNPDMFYGIIDAKSDAPNVASLLFREEQGSFLVGVVAGLMTKSNKIGFIGGLEIPLIKKFEAGFRAGVMSVNPDAEVSVNYAGDFGDPARGKEIAISQYSDGADVIFHAAGGTGLGLFQAAIEQGEGAWAIGVDADQLALAPDNVLTSMMKRVDVAVFDTIKSAVEGNFEGGARVFGLAEDGVGLAPTTSTNTPADVIAKADEFAALIISGDIVVPTNEEELAAFVPPSS